MIVRVMGGAGNQLFIYAAAMSLARKLHANMTVDTVSGFCNDRVYRREYILDQFAITSPPASEHEQFRGTWGRVQWRLLREAENRNLGLKRWAMIDEASLPERYIAKKLYLSGYWHSEDYFKDDADVVRREFQVRHELPSETIAELHSIQAVEQSVAIGIRRFNERPSHQSAYITELDFYHTALQKLASQLPSAHVFVITEEPDWARANLRCPLPMTFISHKNGNRRAFENLVLFRACRHFIIGNSTYHWWGAWLGERPDSLIFVDSRFAEKNPQFYPTRWHKL
jgi:hypothetical protein